MTTFFSSCSNFFVMLHFFFSCSKIFHRNHTIRLEHDKKYWSMTKILEHDKICRYFDRWQNGNLEGDLLRTATKDVFRRKVGKVSTLLEHDKKNGSTSMKRFVMLHNFLSCSQIFIMLPNFGGKNWERDETKCYHAPTFLSCSNFFSHAPNFLSCSKILE